MHGADPRLVLGLHRSGHRRDILTAALDLGVNALDTAAPYHGHHSHRTLAKTAGDLLPRFSVSTKIGYFPGLGHSLDPGHLRLGVELAVRDLGQEPDLVFLHNPEQSLTGASPAGLADRLAAACTELEAAVEQGLCRAWGVSSWDPRPLSAIALGGLPRPEVLMVRAGLLVGVEILDAALAVREAWEPATTWGMSPFGGSATQPVWEMFDPRPFLHGHRDDDGRAQAAFRAAFLLPAVDAVAVSTDNPAHLRELTEALHFNVDEQAAERYLRHLRNQRQG
ncbi:aldo/keto reductase [Streptomyces sp. NBC_01443]|uniref:aldo/keto reductase n=1 Tax=Streptomyces sp. NBC_01443 TaxID=2903868 RepID=UPI0022555AC7|nr:aldo/keto reductase [Streptomyces sp. NBC_01443]MCX4632884.1 aldo/keto reductase [Streptomyces sp. NBC_01443]